MELKGEKVLDFERWGTKVTLNWSWPFVHIVRATIWGRLGRGGWVRTR